MANRETRSVSFTPEQAAFLSTCVESGRYQSASEVVRAALRLLEGEESRRVAELARVRGLVADGLSDLDRGNVVDSVQFFGEWEAKHRRLKGDGSATPR